MHTNKGANHGSPGRVHEHQRRVLGGVKDHPVTHPRQDNGDAFLPDPEGGPIVSPDDLSELLAEEYVASATQGQNVSEETRDAETVDEAGGPFLNVSEDEEFADDIDEANPVDAEREALPSPMRSPRQTN